MENQGNTFVKNWFIPILFAFILFGFYRFFFSFTTNKMIEIYQSEICRDNNINGKTDSTRYDIINPQISGPIGDTFGGTLGPIIGLLGFYITFLAFWIQYRANEQQKQDLKIERFENKFYNMIDLHKQNVNEFELADEYKGRKCFVPMYRELECCYKLINHLSITHAFGIDGLRKIEFAYRIFFFGIGEHSNKQLEYSMKEDEKAFFEVVKNEIEQLHLDFYIWNNPPINEPDDATAFLKNAMWEKDKNSISLINKEILINIDYLPFDGHIHRLAHYYRHLFQTVMFVIEQKDSFLSFEDKLKYLKTLRAQLSNHEQLILFYNSLSIGKLWFVNELNTKYRMIHNLPLPLLFGFPNHNYKEIPSIKKWHKIWHDKGEELFEWDE